MAASSSHRRIEQVLGAARKDLEAQLAAVRGEIARLGAEEQELTATLASLGQARPTAVRTATGASRRRRSPARDTNARTPNRARARARGRGRRAAHKSKAERVEALRALLADGPKSVTDLAGELGVSRARVQQLLGELGNSVSSTTDGPNRAKLWSLKAP